MSTSTEEGEEGGGRGGRKGEGEEGEEGGREEGREGEGKEEGGREDYIKPAVMAIQTFSCYGDTVAMVILLLW